MKSIASVAIVIDIVISIVSAVRTVHRTRTNVAIHRSRGTWTTCLGKRE